ncbi:hypothetical protein ZIOFF_010950 [Zingiber officinale]|uniref:AT1G65230-like protein n=1 Tax=Zingiber officinale TaxID=94328 RepID=A0A8J5HPT2_ZINOF|nr:hypothetical protein ZIOFF_010950 [Zingiber officinale]
MPSAVFSSAFSPPVPCGLVCARRRRSFHPTMLSSSFSSRRRRFASRAVGGSKESQISLVANERSESDRLVDGMDFGELCNEFECISSPQVESTARQLVRDILELREGNRALSAYSVSVKYKGFHGQGAANMEFIEWFVMEKNGTDPIRSFVGREKYNRPLWAIDALENPSVAVQEMVMLSTSVLSIKWTLKGKPKNPAIAGLGGFLKIQVHSLFTLNQISGQVIEHEESWDLSQSSPLAQAYFWVSRRLFSTIESVKDTVDAVKSTTTRLSTQKDNLESYPDPSFDPTKFFQREGDLQRDVYQIALFLAVAYFVVQFLRTTL